MLCTNLEKTHLYIYKKEYRPLIKHNFLIKGNAAVTRDE